MKCSTSSIVAVRLEMEVFENFEKNEKYWKIFGRNISLGEFENLKKLENFGRNSKIF